MSRRIPLSDVTKKQAPGIIQDILDGKAVAYLYLVAHSDYWFYYEDGTDGHPWSGRYRLARQDWMCWWLQHPECTGTTSGTLIDDQGRKFSIGYSRYYDGPNLRDEEGNFQQPAFKPRNFGIVYEDQEAAPAPEPVANAGPLPAAPVDLVARFLAECSPAGMREFGSWLGKRGGSYNPREQAYTWPGPVGPVRKSRSRISNLISELKKAS